MKAKHFEDEDIKIREETISIEFYMPDQLQVDDGEEPDFYIKIKQDYPGFVASPLSIFLEQCEDYDSSQAVISWLEFYIAEIKKRYPLVPNAKLSGKPPHTEL